MASTDAKPVPQKNVAYRVTFPILDADGDLVTGATGLDSEVSKDGGTFADCTNEATEIATSSGVYFLDLTSTEMNADTVAVIVKTSSSGAKTTTIVMYPEEAGDIRVNVTAYGGTAGTFASGRPEVNTTHAAGTAWNSGAIGASTLATDTITAAKIATDAIGASELAADAVAEIQSGLSTLTQANIRTAVGLASANMDTQLATIAGYIDTEVGTLQSTATAIKAKTDQLTFTTSNRVDATAIALDTQAKADVNAEVVDALNVDTYAEVGQENPAATQTIRKMIAYLYKAWRNKTTQTGDQYALYADNATTIDQKATVSDDGSTFTRGEVATGP